MLKKCGEFGVDDEGESQNALIVDVGWSKRSKSLLLDAGLHSKRPGSELVWVLFSSSNF